MILQAEICVDNMLKAWKKILSQVGFRIMIHEEKLLLEYT
jgi:hypothetical protein